VQSRSNALRHVPANSWSLRARMVTNLLFVSAIESSQQAVWRIDQGARKIATIHQPEIIAKAIR